MPQPPHTITQICAALTEQGHPDLAKRIAYFASDEDLEEGEAPVTLESALGFWEFFSQLESDTRAALGCSAEGVICADWRFDDLRITAIWFLDKEKVRFAARQGNGQWLDLHDSGDTCLLAELTAKLVEAGLFKWRLKHPDNWSSNLSTTLLDIAGDAS